MALTYTVTMQDKIAHLLRNAPYDSLDETEKAVIDGAATPPTITTGQAYDALVQIQQVGQWFSMTPASAASLPAEWEPWWIARTVMMAGQVLCPDRRQQYVELHDDAEMVALDAYARTAITADPGATPEAAVLTVQNIRYYITSLCVRRASGWETVEGSRRRRPRKWIPFELVDACTEKVIRNLWNRANWNFKARSGTITLTRYDASDATYTHATKTITKTGEFAAAIAAGATVRVTAGTGATLGTYIAASGTANTVVLTASLGSDANGQTDIDCEVINVTNNLVGETFHQFASRELYYADDPGRSIKWATNDEIAQAKAAAADGASGGRPYMFNWEDNGGALTWHFWPEIDRSYTLCAFSYVKGPALTTLSTTTTALARFPREFDNVIKDAIFAEVLDKINDPDAGHQLEKSEDEITRLLPIFAEAGKPDDNPKVRDIYNDYRYQNRSPWGESLGLGGL